MQAVRCLVRLDLLLAVCDSDLSESVGTALENYNTKTKCLRRLTTVSNSSGTQTRCSTFNTCVSIRRLLYPVTAADERNAIDQKTNFFSKSKLTCRISE